MAVIKINLPKVGARVEIKKQTKKVTQGRKSRKRKVGIFMMMRKVTILLTTLKKMSALFLMTQDVPKSRR
jgi:hypothetical protein